MSVSATLTAIPQIPHIQPGDDVAELMLAALEAAGIELRHDDILAIAQKIISKSEGRFRELSTIEPSYEARELAALSDKDPRLVQLILHESEEVSRVRRGLIIVRHRLGFTCANAGIDRSNVSQSGDDETVLLLPVDPDASAQRVHARIRATTGRNVGIVITDSHGRPFRNGTVGVAIGVAGIPALWDRRGEQDLYGYVLQHTDVGFADEISAAAGLLMGQASEGTPVVHIRGIVGPQGDGKASDLVRSKGADLYR
jgi:coenzyme F420-0:L-glutamate ligase/coenzyme F420-1:gamma-L-glutamate ligase